MSRGRSLIIRFLFFFGGLYIVAFGKIFLIESKLGVDPWTVFHMGISNYIPLTVGQVTQGVGAIMLLIGWALGINPSFGTFLNMYLYGFFLDLNIALNETLKIAKPADNLAVSVLYIILGTVISGIGLGIYLNGKLGAGPRDSFMLGVSKFTGKKPGIIKTYMESTAVIIGWLLGGPVGLGTLSYALFSGTIMQWTLDHIKLPQERKESSKAMIPHDV